MQVGSYEPGVAPASGHRQLDVHRQPQARAQDRAAVSHGRWTAGSHAALHRRSAREHHCILVAEDLHGISSHAELHAVRSQRKSRRHVHHPHHASEVTAQSGARATGSARASFRASDRYSGRSGRLPMHSHSPSRRRMPRRRGSTSMRADSNGCITRSRLHCSAVPRLLSPRLPS